MNKKQETIIETEGGRRFEAENEGFHHAADGTKLHQISECRPGRCWTDEPKGPRSRMAKEPCADYEGSIGYGQYLDGNPCANCRRPEAAHSDDARKRWISKVRTMTF